jgi:ribosomal protein L27
LENSFVSTKLKNFSLDTLKGEAAAVLTNDAGNIVSVIGSHVLTRAIASGGTSYDISIACTVPRTVREGQYTLRIAVKPEGENNWKIVTKANASINVRSSYSISVIAAEAIVYDYGIVLKEFSAKASLAATSNLSSIRQGEMFHIGYNLGYTEDNALFSGQTGAVLVDNANNIIAFILTHNQMSVSMAVNQSIPASVPPGQYKLMVAIKPEGKEWRIVQRTAPGIVNGIPITVTGAAQLAGLWGLP